MKLYGTVRVKNRMRAGALIAVGVLLMLAPMAADRKQSFHINVPGTGMDVGCGQAVSGLQLCAVGGNPTLKLEFRNLGSTPLKLNMGLKSGNGDEHPRLRLAVRVGEERYQLRDMFLSSIHGTIYTVPWVVTIPARSTYAIAVDLNHWVPRVNVPHWLSAEYSEPRIDGPSDYWTGMVKSDEWWFD